MVGFCYLAAVAGEELAVDPGFVVDSGRVYTCQSEAFDVLLEGLIFGVGYLFALNYSLQYGRVPV